MADNAITIICAILASNGLWVLCNNLLSKKSASNQMLVGLAHDRIIYLGMKYIERGFVTKDEYENLKDYLYVPYEKLGGNGTAKKVMQEVNKLPIK